PHIRPHLRYGSATSPSREKEGTSRATANDPTRLASRADLPSRGRWTAALFLHGARHRRDVVLDEEGIEDDNRQRADQGAGHQRAPFVDVGADELGKHADRHGLVLRRLDEGQRVDELVPGQRESEDAGRY